MSKLDQVIEKVRQLPRQRQDEIIEVVESMAAPSTEFTAEQREKIERGLAQLDRGEGIPIEKSFLSKFRDV